MTERKKSGIAAMLEGKTSALGEKLDKNQNPSLGIQSQPPVTMPGQLGAFRLQAQQWQERIRQLEEELRRAKDQGSALELPLDDLIEVPGRRRKLTPEEYIELRENLRKHNLITPVSVRVLPEGKYEIVSGHNRVAIYRELGRTKIKAWLADSDADRAEELAFYANLFHPDLTAYEKYIGLKKVMQSNPQLKTLNDISDHTGLNKTLVGELLTMDNLPRTALTTLAKKPTALGSRAIAQMAALAKEGSVEQVIEAINKAVTEGIEQQEALRIASAKPKPTTTPASKPEPKTIRAGRRNYCNMIGAKKTIRLEFQSEEERAEVEAMIEALLKQQAELKK